MQLWAEGCVGGWHTRGVECVRSHWLWKIPLAGQLAFATWHLKSFAHAKANTHARNHIHAQQTQIFASRTQTHTHTNTRIHRYVCVACLIRRRSEPSTAQFRNFYGKSSLIKFNELWKRQQISRGQLCCKVCPRWYFLWADVRRQRQLQPQLPLLHFPPPLRTLEKQDLAGTSICVAVVNWRMWFLWVAGSIIKCGIKSVAHVEV